MSKEIRPQRERRTIALDINGKVVYERRRQLGLTQGDLSFAAEMDRSYLSQIESGHIQHILPPLARRLAAALNEEISFFCRNDKTSNLINPDKPLAEALKELQSSLRVLDRNLTRAIDLLEKGS